MKITLLGTGTSSGVPMIGCDCEVCTSTDPRDTRLRSAAMIQTTTPTGEPITIVIDPGPDFRQQMLRHQVRKIDAVLITHHHKDHMGGMDDLRSYYYMSKRPVAVYCKKEVIKVIKTEFNYAFKRKVTRFAAVPRFELHRIRGGQRFSVQGLEIMPIGVMHDKLKIVGYRIGEACYITDANHITEKSLEQMKGLKVLIINALRRKEHVSHFNLQQTLQIIQKTKPQRAILTHISHQMGTTQQTQKELPTGVEIGFDNLEIIC